MVHGLVGVLSAVLEVCTFSRLKECKSVLKRRSDDLLVIVAAAAVGLHDASDVEEAEEEVLAERFTRRDAGRLGIDGDGDGDGEL